MSKYIKKIYDCETKITTEIEMSAEEIAQYESDKELYFARKSESEAKAKIKSDLLDRLGITQDEAKLLLS